jgi:hypothetical protein
MEVSASAADAQLNLDAPAQAGGLSFHRWGNRRSQASNFACETAGFVAPPVASSKRPFSSVSTGRARRPSCRHSIPQQA